MVTSTGFEPMNVCVKGICVNRFTNWPQKMVGLGGLEPPTSRLSGVRSNQLSYKPISCVDYYILQNILLFCNIFLLISLNFAIIYIGSENMLNKPSQENVDKFINSATGKVKNEYLKKTAIYGVIAIMIGLIWTILNVFYNLKWYEYISPIALFAFGIYFIIQSKRLLYQEVNKFIHNEKNKK
jgi:hypothetical protein